MILCDVNLLVYATVRSMPLHEPALRWLKGCLGREELGLCHVALFGFVRIVTNRKIFSNPRSVDDVLRDIETWLQSGAEIVLSGPRFLPTAIRLLRETGTAGNLTTDAQLAALALEHNMELHSADNDFARFRGLKWHNPLR
jgi:uncharacterized protein